MISNGVKINTLSHIKHEWPANELYTSFEPAIVTAARLGNYEICKILLKNHANTEKTDSTQMTALHWACELNNISIVKLLLQFKANLKAIDLKNQTPLEKCILKNNEFVFNYLLDHVNFEFHYYEMLLEATERFNHEILKTLLKERQIGKVDYDLNQVDNSVGSLLHYAVILSNLENSLVAKKSELKRDISDYLTTIETLIENGIEVNLPNKLKETPLHVCRNRSVADLLLTYGARMDMVEITGKTPLFSYFCRSHYDLCLELLKHGSEIEIIDRLGNSLFSFIAHSNAPIQFIVLLMEAGISFNKEPWVSNNKTFPQRLRKKYPKLMNYMQWRARNPYSLKEICRKAVRSHLYNVNSNKSVLNRVLHLPVPTTLQDYILFNLNIK